MPGVITKFMGVLVIVGGLVCLYGSTKLEARIERIALAVTGFSLFSVGANIIKHGRRQQQPSAEELLARDPRPPVFLLRAFTRDNESVSVRVPFRLKDSSMLSPSYYMSQATTTAEELLVRKLQEIGPVVALGRSRENLQPLGASRFYVPDANWQESFLEILNRASLIVMVVDDTAALKWELKEISGAGKLSKLILVLSRRGFSAWPSSVWSIAEEKDLEVWQKLRDEFSFLPEVSGNTAAVTFNEAGRTTSFQSVNGAITAYASLAGV